MLQLVFATCFTKTVDNQNEFAFGLNNGLPWGHISQDLKNFKARTSDSVLIMGAKTFESFQSPLPNRRHVVVCNPERALPKTRNGTTPSEVITPEEFERFLNGETIVTSKASKNYPWDTVVGRDRCDISIIGGKTLIQQAITRVDKIVHTSIIKNHRVNSDVQIEKETIFDIHARNKMVETHWYAIDELTHITESVWVPKD